MDSPQKRLKQLEMLGSLGAGILGAGLALLLVRWLGPYSLPILIVGILSHGWAMFAKCRLEREANIVQPAWAVAAERLCWAMIAGLVIYIAALQFP
jgi:hypothetical protein